MKRGLLESLVCPADGTDVALEARTAHGAEVVEGTLTCTQRHRYAITGGVPRLLCPDTVPDAATRTRESFSAKWRRIPDFGHEPASRDVYVAWYLQRYGFADLDDLRGFLAKKQRILEAGTGVGRDARLYAENAPGEVFALDVSASIEIAYEHLGHLPNLHLLQADLTTPPFRPATFDFVACDQVLHHTPDTRASFLELVRLLAPGGELAFYVYKRKGPIREFCDDFLRRHYTHAGDEEAYRFSRAMTALGKALSDLHAEVEVPENIPILGIAAGRYDVQRFIYWNVFKCYWNDRLDFETNVMTNFDWYTPQYAYRHTPEEVRGWCEAAGLDIVRFDVIESGISVRARKPEAVGR